MIWRAMIGFGAAVGLLWLTLVLFLVIARPTGGILQEGIRILPDTLGLLRRLMTDPSTPRTTRRRLWLLFAYLASPIDLVPDFIPGIGYADDAIIVAATLRSIVRQAGPAVIREHWPGSPAGLAALWRLARLDGDTATNETQPTVPNAGDAFDTLGD